jgi:hypothetical protein
VAQTVRLVIPKRLEGHALHPYASIKSSSKENKPLQLGFFTSFRPNQMEKKEKAFPSFGQSFECF